MSVNPIHAAVAEFSPAPDDYKSGTRGRPGRSPHEKANYELRRADFSRHMRRLRKEAGLTIAEAARLSGVSSARKLAQYESICYPPGEVLRAFVAVYNVGEKELAELLLSRMDPALYEMLTGKSGYKPTRSEISAYIKHTSQQEPEE